MEWGQSQCVAPMLDQAIHTALQCKYSISQQKSHFSWLIKFSPARLLAQKRATEIMRFWHWHYVFFLSEFRQWPCYCPRTDMLSVEVNTLWGTSQNSLQPELHICIPTQVIQLLFILLELSIFSIKKLMTKSELQNKTPIWKYWFNIHLSIHIETA